MDAFGPKPGPFGKAVGKNAKIILTFVFIHVQCTWFFQCHIEVEGMVQLGFTLMDMFDPKPGPFGKAVKIILTFVFFHVQCTRIFQCRVELEGLVQLGFTLMNVCGPKPEPVGKVVKII